jgi:heme-degrading monooxygenase HmoA
MTEIAALPEPPYYAVIFTTLRTDVEAGYGAMADKMDALAREQPGYIGIESAREQGGLGITVSYWESETALIAWKQVAEHSLAQKLGRERWYKHYALRVAKVERQYSGPEGRG